MCIYASIYIYAHMQSAYICIYTYICVHISLLLAPQETNPSWYRLEKSSGPGSLSMIFPTPHCSFRCRPKAYGHSNCQQLFASCLRSGNKAIRWVDDGSPACPDLLEQLSELSEPCHAACWKAKGSHSLLAKCREQITDKP